MHIVKQLAFPTFVNLGVKDFCDFIFRFSANLDQRRRRLNVVWNGVRSGRLEHGNMKYRVNSAHSVGESESKGMRARLSENGVWAEVLLG